MEEKRISAPRSTSCRLKLCDAVAPWACVEPATRDIDGLRPAVDVDPGPKDRLGSLVARVLKDLPRGFRICSSLKSSLASANQRKLTNVEQLSLQGYADVRGTRRPMCSQKSAAIKLPASPRRIELTMKTGIRTLHMPNSRREHGNSGRGAREATAPTVGPTTQSAHPQASVSWRPCHRSFPYIRHHLRFNSPSIASASSIRFTPSVLRPRMNAASSP
jgi:hypothetical protein